MKRTFAHNSVVIGVLLGIYVWALTENAVLSILACVVASVVGFVVIRLIENLMDKGKDKVVDAVGEAYQRHKNNRNGGSK